MKRSIVVCIVIAFAGVWLVSHVVSSLAQVDRANAAPAIARPASVSQAFKYNPSVAEMISTVQQITVTNYMSGFTGAQPVMIGGAPYTILTRYTASGVPIEKATQYVYEHFQSLGLATSYDDWSANGYSGRNVIGVLTGTTQPDQIVVISAHMDSLPETSPSPGADDNATGSIGVIMAADALSHYHFARTVRFILFTGEEQVDLGSKAYVAAAIANGDNIVADYDMVMIGYDHDNDRVLSIHTRPLTDSGALDLAIANVFTNVVGTYLPSGALLPQVDADGLKNADHASFWDANDPAVLAIEDIPTDTVPNRHSTDDNLTVINWEYLTNYIKASVGTAAQLAEPLIPVAPNLTPTAAAQPGFPGVAMRYTFQVSNTDASTEIFTASVAGGTWPVTVVTPIGPVAGNAALPVTVTILVPPNAISGTKDVVTLTVAPSLYPMSFDTAVLTTTAINPKKIYLPLVIR